MITLLDRSVWDWNQVVEGGNIIHIEIKALQAVDTEKAIMQHQHSLGTRLGKKLNQSAPIYEQVKRRRGVVLDTASEGLDSLFVPIVTVFVPIVTKYT
jgi:hypothetical protein